MAFRLNMSQSAYSRIEVGRSNNWIPLIPKLCKELSITPNQLFSSEELIINLNNDPSTTQNNAEFHNAFNKLSDKVDKVLDFFEKNNKNL